MIADALANVLNPVCLFLIWAGTVIGIIFGSVSGRYFGRTHFGNPSQNSRYSLVNLNSF